MLYENKGEQRVLTCSPLESRLLDIGTSILHSELDSDPEFKKELADELGLTEIELVDAVTANLMVFPVKEDN